MFEYLSDMGIESNIFILLFLLLFVSALAFFHSLFLALFKKNENSLKWMKFKNLFLIYNIIAILLFIIHPGLTVGWIGFLFISIFVVFILLLITGIGARIFLTIKDLFTEKSRKPAFRKIVGFFASLLFIVLFLYAGPFSFFILFVFIFVTFIFSNKNQFNKLQEILPTSKIRSMAMGLVEVQGNVKAIDLFTTPINSKQCIGYKYTIESISIDKDGDKSYTTIHNESKCKHFFIEDQSGRVEVSPEKLELIMFPIDERYSNSSKRYTQYVLYEDEEVLLIGKATLENNIPIIRHEGIKNVFGVAPAVAVNRWNRLKPMRSAILMYVIAFAFLVSCILLLSIEEINGMIVVSLPDNIFSWNIF